jgi:hypothetical protein
MTESNSTIKSMVEMQLWEPVDEDSYEGIHGVLTAAARNHISSRIVISKYIELAQFYNSTTRYRESIDLLLDAIHLSPISNEIYTSLGQSLALFTAEYKEEFCDEDIRWLSAALEYLHSINEGPEGAHHQLNHNPGILSFNKALKTLEIQDDGQAESVHTHFLSSISLKQYQNLTPEERRQKVSEIFARKLLELEKAKKGKGGKSDA